MKKYIIQSINLMNDHILLVFILSAIEISLVVLKFPLLMILLVVLRFVALVYIYGFLTDHILSRKTGFEQIISSNVLNYVIVRIIMGVPIIILVIISAPFGLTVQSVIRMIASFFIILLTVYVIPLIFIKRTNIQAIKPGIQYFMDNLVFNRPFMGFIGLQLLFMIIASTLTADPKTGTILARFVLQFIINYINFLVFVLAALILVQKSGLMQETELFK